MLILTYLEILSGKQSPKYSSKTSAISKSNLGKTRVVHWFSCNSNILISLLIKAKRRKYFQSNTWDIVPNRDILPNLKKV